MHRLRRNVRDYSGSRINSHAHRADALRFADLRPGTTARAVVSSKECHWPNVDQAVLSQEDVELK